MTTAGVAGEWRRSWPVVIAGAVGLGTTSLHFYSLGMFIQPLTEQFGWSRAQITAGPAIVAIINLFIAAAVGRMADRVGVRRVAIPGFVAYCLAIAALGLAGPSIWSWYLLWAILGPCLTFTGPALYSLAIASRFDKSRAMALAVAMCGIGIIGLLVPLLGAPTLARFGWSATYAILGGSVLIVGLPILLLCLNSAHDMRRKAAGAEATAAVPALPGLSFAQAIAGRHFWLLTASAFLIGAGIAALIVHFISIGIQNGINPVQAAKLAGLIGLSTIFGRIFSGIMLDRLPGRLVGAGLFLMPLVGCIILSHLGGSTTLMAAAAIVIGFATGAEFDVLAVLASRYLGMRAFAAIYGQIAAVFGLGVGMGPAIGGAMYDAIGSYGTMLWVLGAVFAVAAGLLAVLGRYPESFPDAG